MHLDSRTRLPVRTPKPTELTSPTIASKTQSFGNALPSITTGTANPTWINTPSTFNAAAQASIVSMLKSNNPTREIIPSTTTNTTATISKSSPYSSQNTAIQATTPSASAFTGAGPIDDSISSPAVNPITSDPILYPTSTLASDSSQASGHRRLPASTIAAMSIVLVVIGALVLFVFCFRKRSQVRRDQDPRPWRFGRKQRVSHLYEDNLVAMAQRERDGDVSPLPESPASLLHKFPHAIPFFPRSKFGRGVGRQRNAMPTIFLETKQLRRSENLESSSPASTQDPDSAQREISSHAYLMSVRPFSASEAFNFPMPPSTQNEHSPTSTDFTVSRMDIVRIPPIPPLPNFPPPVPTSHSGPFAHRSTPFTHSSKVSSLSHCSPVSR